MRLLSNTHRLLGTLRATLALAMFGTPAQAQTATNITGLYYTGLNSGGGLAAGGTQAADWNITYASLDGGSTAATSYEGAGYVISPASISGSGYTPNTGGAQ